MDETERIAEHVLASLYRGAEVEYLEEQSSGQHDFAVRTSQGESLAVEVTCSIVEELEAGIAAVLNEDKGGPRIERVRCKAGWWLIPNRSARINQIRTLADAYLAAIEAAGLERATELSAPYSPPVKALVMDLGVEYAVSLRKPVHHHLGTPTADGGPISSTYVVEALSVELAKPDNRRKLKKARADSRHLFVEIHPRNFLPWIGLIDNPPPEGGLALPDGVDAVWAVASDRDNLYRVWRFHAGEGWRDFGSVAVPKA